MVILCQILFGENMGIADLHIHTTASDGTYSPSEVVKKAKDMGFKAIAITDHDTIDGLEEGKAAGKKLGLEVISGIELNTFIYGKEIHILGYEFDANNKGFLALVESLGRARKKRVNEIISKLNELGLNITIDEVVQQNATSSAIGRPHIAQVLVKKGYVSTIREAFDKYIGINCPAYVYRYKLTPQEAVRKIKEANGIPVIAHPFLIGYDQIINELIPYGLKGIEVYHSDHNQEQSEHYLRLAQKYNLLITGGSDDHGALKGASLLGKVRLPYYYVEKLKEVKDEIVGERDGNSIKD